MFKTIGYDFTRRSNRDYTHAVIYKNVSDTNPGISATWHTSKALAEKSAKAFATRSHLKVIEIVEVKAK
jgi:hypothetical protein